MPDNKLPQQSARIPWGVFPPVWIHASETAVKQHPAYGAAKVGDPDAAYKLVIETRSLDIVSKQTGWRADDSIVQTNIVAHTGADGFSRLARQAEFGGDVARGQSYVLVDDFVGQGGTLANLRSHIIRGGGIVIGATVLTGKAHSALLALAKSTLEALRKKHETELENWWHQRFGFNFDCLTESEAHYLLNTPSADRVRNQIAAAVQV